MKAVKLLKKLTKKIIIAFALIFTTTGISFANGYADGDVIVVLKPQTQQDGKVALSAVSVAETFASAANAKIKETYEEISNSENGVFALLHSDTMNAEEFAEELKNDPDVLAAMPNYEVKLAALPDDSEFSEENCWGMYAIGAPEAWSTNTGSSNVYVAVIDSGVDYTNPDISANYNAYYSSQYSSQKDTHGHGTHVAGIIGAKGNNGMGVAGVNWNVNLIAVNALPSGRGGISDIIKALNFVTGLINSGVNIKAVNLSLQVDINMAPTYANLVNNPFWRAFKALDEINQAVIVVAAGNSGVTIGEYSSSTGGYAYPASFTGLNNMISVGALNQNHQLASFSNKGADIAAPGVDILSTYIQSGNSNTVSTKLMKGTSMATPFVAGAAALLASINSELTAYQIKTILLNGYSGVVSAASSEKIFDLSSGIEYYNDNKTKITELKPSSNSDYDNSNNTEDTADGYVDSNSSGGGGGCNGLMIGIFAAIIFLPLAKKFKH